MFRHLYLRSFVLMFIGGSLLTEVRPGYAAGTPAGTLVTNQADVAYKIPNSSTELHATSTPSTFVVDRLINFNVQSQNDVSGSGYVKVGPANTQDQVLTFTITNDSNDKADFLLLYDQNATGTQDQTNSHGEDFFDTLSPRIYKDTNGNLVFDSNDMLVTYLDDIGSGEAVTVFVVSNMPTPLPANGKISSGILTAKSATTTDNGSGNGLYLPSNTSGQNNGSTTVETVLNDPAGDVTGDTTRDGKHSDSSGYIVSIPDIVVRKVVRIISDPMNGTTNPKAVPGATVEYCIETKNGGSETASDIRMTDTIPTNSDYATSSIVVANPGTINAQDECTGGSSVTDAQGYDASTKTVTTTVTSLAPTASTTTRFHVIIK